MRIAQVTKYFHPHHGGIESNVLGISRGIVEKGNEVLVFTSNIPRGRRHEIHEGIEICRARNLFTAFNAPFSLGIFLGLLRNDYDLIHVHSPDPFNEVFAWLASRIKGRPLIITYHSDIIKDRFYHLPFRLLFGIIEKRILAHASRIIATTQAYADGSKALKRFRNKITIIPNFVDAGEFNPAIDGSKVRERYGLGKERIVLFFGRLVPYKGVEYLIDAFKGVKGATLVIAGRGPLKEKLMKRAKKIPGVRFIVPEDDEIPLLYSCCDVFVLPSVTRAEAFGITLLEAMASGKPTITTNMSGMPSVVGDTGILVKPKDSKELSKAIQKLLSDKNLRKDLGEKARTRVGEEFTLPLVVEKTERLYNEI
ncbi:MAG: glycosyltransferase [Candidatus Altiarchaeales archaeon]|nr:glycosyltransferase [Candidatus Altiarchaeota archaeon]MBU4341120.1 glycosyltransferase [Candidatus Altiarchaeota archaeon]MBU4406868.1 glycosyltransferase [Candidatus Altiarchaeota archaeon]MBU4437882.1 glycosyltransferase [Candidatus Altiarchaeota archaeon]MCG2782171.1 glycosyltransferase [Candidatus Altiarchaeales archaeon]